MKVRVLKDITVDGVNYAAGAFVDLPDAIAKPLDKVGSVDADKEAIAYCAAEGIELVSHKAAENAASVAAADPEQR